MEIKPLRIGLIGAGANTRTRHIPGLRTLPGVEMVVVCNRRLESTEEVARTYGIPRIATRWQDVIADHEIDAVVIGTWPYLHCPITLAAFEMGKHVLTEARLAMNASEAHRMLAASRARPDLVAQVVPSPFGLRGRAIVKACLAEGYLGELREVQVQGFNAALADEASLLSWRQDAALSGFNMLTLGILHETLSRWVPPPVQVLAQVHAHIPSRIDPESGVRRAVGTPDSVQVLAVLENGARAVYHLSGVTPFGQSMRITLLGSDGVLDYDLTRDRLRGASRRQGATSATLDDLKDISLPSEAEAGWRVEADFVASVREGHPVELTDFPSAVAYMEFTEAVARSARSGEPVALPLEDHLP